ncbi:MAG TPA: aldo/keto reductase [Tepidisphaeraceae bacterium]|jgi:aryl-alcohol dehydrogenase-like predicted oxidoreductase
MKYIRLGKTGLKVSQICLGCMSYGVPERGPHLWTLPEEKALPFFKQAIDGGINFFDTANVYSHGTSEEITGKAIKEFSTRDAIVLTTKVNGRMRADANGAGLSRKAILSEIDHSLKRLGTDYVDLYQIHRWDYQTPIEETLEALNDVVRAGKARYIGASSMFAWQFARALAISEAHGWSQFVSMQNYYNLIYREEEREMMPLCQAMGVGVIPWSPLARGRLTRPWDNHETTQRESTDEFGKTLYQKNVDTDRAVVNRLGEVAAAQNIPMAQAALAWQFTKPYITAPIIGATKPHHLKDAIAATEISLSAEEIAKLEEPYVPHPVLGHQ